MTDHPTLRTATSAVWQASKLVWAVVLLVAGLIVLGLIVLVAYGLSLGVVA